MPKKPVINAYALFVADQKKHGVRFQGDAYQYFGPAWQALPEHERAHFTELARDLKFKQRSELECKFTTSGQSYAEVERIRAERGEKLSQMNQTIQDTVAGLALENKLAQHPFYLMHVNYYCASDQGVYYPAEVGLVKFSLAGGVQDFYHKILNPGQFPTGSFRNAMEHSKETHNLPCPPDPKIAEADFNKIDKEIKEFLLGAEGLAQAVGAYRRSQRPIRLPPLYTYYSKEMLHFNKDSDVVVRSFMAHLPDGQREKYDVRVYELPKLLFELCNACAQQAGLDFGFPSIVAAQAELERDVFSHCVGIACPFHEDGDYASFCSLSWARRWAFTLADFCCKHLGIHPVPGLHCPIKAAPFQRIEAPQQEQFLNGRPQRVPVSVPTPAAPVAEVTKKRVPVAEPLKELRQPQVSCVDALASQFSDKLRTSGKPAGN
ncbi:protein maelstrom homolog isoform X2 [Bacillus rossius redtenbacheri]|uniref:protein maelstrom homolog isoform X2 n=1 Tax=Bacillus rossius redtenbacheri TaxID=93214 RepID=UPI002FDD5DD1